MIIFLQLHKLFQHLFNEAPPVEIIKGNNTSQKSIAKAFDFVRVLKKLQ